jgi:UPF0755 protein
MNTESVLLKQRLIVVGALVLTGVILFFHTPTTFVPDTLVSIESGASLSEAAADLERAHVITSPVLLRIAVLVTGGASSIKAGDYFFKQPEGTLMVAWRLSRGRYGITPTRVLLPEGSSSRDMGKILARSMPRIDATAFAAQAKPFEGYLFPDTYFFLPTATSGMVIAHLQETFDEKTATLFAGVASTSRSREDIVIMASILEEEARTSEDRTIVSGILWKRLDAGKRLQVDAPFAYLLGKTSSELTQDDLAIDSPYNTYLHAGLPPTPITNPGLASLEAAANPTTTPYWFYLSDDEGVMHYATTFEGHLINKQKYIH